MTMYRVTYEIDVEAETPTEAAREAYDCMIDSESAPPILDVILWVDNNTPEFTSDAKGVTSIDLSEAIEQ